MKTPVDTDQRQLPVNVRGNGDLSRPSLAVEDEATLARLKDTQEHLERIRKQHEEMNRLREMLETRQVKQTQFANSRREWMDKLNRSLASLDREIGDAEKLLDHLQTTRDSFARHAAVLRSFHPENWHEDEIQEQLDRALAAVEEASAEHQKHSSRLNNLRQTLASGSEPLASHNFMSGVPQDIARAGLAFTAPLMICLALLWLLSRIF